MAGTGLGFRSVKVVAVAAQDLGRARKFYGETLGLAEERSGDMVGYKVGETIFLPKTGWYGAPTKEPNPRITLLCEDAARTEAALRKKGVAISDPVVRDGDHAVGGFLDSEGNKIWFCS